ncbi:RNA-directed DNA polymerase [Cupriavidus sp. UGS-1]|uniref:RNA-directed DNA polymerase n=1 Tax=Cupriavidus sp. UGS-1 TaxID=2899826 RepID=UPI001E4DD33B|nr:RNA-directed DNA polymerase [Cupriavidus sp. UGS-1]MCD9122398.1 RNA-directed DNA polymerase [Cupriavidus sp. UGS-1]
MDINTSIIAALRNVAQYGDTDIFSYPFENLLFRDRLTEASKLIRDMHEEPERWLSLYPPQTMRSLTQVGYTGFRWATLIDPFWNAYYLSLVLSIADKIESVRLPEASGTIFSYRFHWQDTEAKIFKDSSWIDYRRQCIALSESFPVVVQTDISDFYPRIYHHRIENALKRVPGVGDQPKRLMDLLGQFSQNVSYGLPVGGPASRLLAELSLDGVDKLLDRRGVRFCRYADDYAIFCTDKAEAYRTLVFLSEKLSNEGLVLQKKKTRILTAQEFRETAQLLDPAEAANALATEEQKLLSISLRFDPYSPNAEDEYEELKGAIQEIDIIGILGREIAKSTIDSAVAKHAVQAISVLEPRQQLLAVAMLLDPDNIMTLAPIFTTVMRVVREIYLASNSEARIQIDNALCALWTERSPLLSVEVNLSYYIKTLAGEQTQQKEEILLRVFDSSANPMIRRLVILVMARWSCHYWLSDAKTKYGAMSIFERRAFIIASYHLGDEGRHWRAHVKSGWSDAEHLIQSWYSDRFQSNKSVPV